VTQPVGGPDVRWAEALAAWALPQALLDAAPSDPWSLDPGSFGERARRARDRSTPADEAASSALPRRGVVLDVGCGAGAASAPLWAAVRQLVGVDGSAGMLAALEELVAERGGARRRLRRRPRVTTIEGRWPDVAGRVPVADVVVCHDVLYNVGQDVTRFVEELGAHARRRVVVVLPERHPRSWLTPYFEQLHGLPRPSRPSADLAADVVRATGARPEVLRWTTTHDHPGGEELVRRVAAATCVGPERLDDVRAALERTPPPTTRAMAGLVWDGAAA